MRDAPVNSSTRSILLFAIVRDIIFNLPEAPEQIHEEYPSVPVEAIEVIKRRLMKRKDAFVEIKA